MCDLSSPYGCSVFSLCVSSPFLCVSIRPCECFIFPSCLPSHPPMRAPSLVCALYSPFVCPILSLCVPCHSLMCGFSFPMCAHSSPMCVISPHMRCPILCGTSHPLCMSYPSSMRALTSFYYALLSPMCTIFSSYVCSSLPLYEFSPPPIYAPISVPQLPLCKLCSPIMCALFFPSMCARFSHYVCPIACMCFLLCPYVPSPPPLCLPYPISTCSLSSLMFVHSSPFQYCVQYPPLWVLYPLLCVPYHLPICALSPWVCHVFTICWLSSLTCVP